MKFDGAFWKKIRLKQGLSQSEVAAELNYSSSQMVSNWERGLCNPPHKDLKKLLEMYKVNVDTYIEDYLKKERSRLKVLFKSS